MYEANLAIQVLPKVDDDRIVPIVDEVIAYIKSTGLSCFVGPSETSVEGTLDELCEIVKESQKICIRAGAPSVMSYIKFGYSPSAGVLTIDQKVTKHHA